MKKIYLRRTELYNLYKSPMSSSSTYVNLVTRMTQDFKSKCSDEDAATVFSGTLSKWETEMKQHFTGKPEKKPRQKRERDPDAKPRTNWQAIWTSNKNGCSAYEPFHAQLEEIRSSAKHLAESREASSDAEGKTDKKKNNETAPFRINKQLKEWARENNLYAQWQEWAKDRLVAEGKPVPPETAEKPEKPEKPERKSRASAAGASDDTTATVVSAPVDPKTAAAPEKKATRSRTKAVAA